MIRTLIALLLLCGALPLAAQEPVRVWVNTGSGVYHCPGTPAFSNTKRGEYLSEDEARRRGFRANEGRLCSSPGALDGDPKPALPDVPPVAPSDSMTACTLTHVFDGDTLECASIGKVRLIGIDTPEAGQPTFGSAATAALASLLPRGDTIWLETDLQARDRYGRLLAYVWYGGRMINWILVRQGWAVSGRYPPNLRYAAELEAAEQRARGEHRGLWRIDGFRCRPGQYRNRACPQ
jgi:endonuclease YncB( thermonuclease family)